MGGLWKGEMGKREREKKGKEDLGGHLPLPKRKKEKDRECYLRKIER